MHGFTHTDHRLTLLREASRCPAVAAGASPDICGVYFTSTSIPARLAPVICICANVSHTLMTTVNLLLLLRVNGRLQLQP